jgi:hypothetical protein
MVAVLSASGDNLTREKVMKQAVSLHDLALPMLLPQFARPRGPRSERLQRYRRAGATADYTDMIYAATPKEIRGGAQSL